MSVEIMELTNKVERAMTLKTNTDEAEKDLTLMLNEGQTKPTGRFDLIDGSLTMSDGECAPITIAKDLVDSMLLFRWMKSCLEPEPKA